MVYRRFAVLALAVVGWAWMVNGCQSPGMEEGAAGGKAYQGADRILVPAEGWTCGMPGGIPVPERGVPVFEATMTLDQVHDVGLTQYGQRSVYVVSGGTVTGEKFNGTVMPGGLDFQLRLSNGTLEVEQIFVLRGADGRYICLRSAGTACDPGDVRMVPDFEAPNAGANNWLNSGKYAGRRVVDVAGKTMKISVFDVSAVQVAADATNSVAVTRPAGVPGQPWDYRRAGTAERRGDLLITETVALGQGQSVGPTKNGNRNIIPITGGTLRGKITGKVLPGGADYQNLGNPATIDARYLWQTDEGEVIIVRNAGPMASLVPTFEARVDGRCAYLNTGLYLSSSPGMGGGGVQLSFYESRQ